MAYKERGFICEICGDEFLSRRKAPRSCSKSCKMKLMGKQLKSEKVKVGICEWCNNEFEYVPNNKNPIYRFCSQDCRHKAHVEDIKKNGLDDKTKRKISDSLKGKSLKDRGFSDESIANSVKAIREAGKEWNEAIKGKTYEEIHGEEKAKNIKNLFSENRRGNNNPQSLMSISKRFNCSLEEATMLTSCFGRCKELHPMYGKNQSVETKQKIVKTLQENGLKSFRKIASGTFNNIAWQGSWELQFLIKCYEKEIEVKRYYLEPIEYNIGNKKRHYFPDFIVNDRIVVEIKNPNQLKQTTIKKKGEAAERIFGNNYVIISEGFDNKTTRKRYYKQMQEKYKDILIINHNPHEELND